MSTQIENVAVSNNEIKTVKKVETPVIEKTKTQLDSDDESSDENDVSKPKEMSYAEYLIRRDLV